MRKTGLLVGFLFLVAGCGRDEGGKAPGLTDANFEREVLQSDIPVLVDFWGEG